MIARRICDTKLPLFLANESYFRCLLGIAEHHCQKEIPERKKEKIHKLSCTLPYFFEIPAASPRISPENRLIKMGFLALHCNTHFTCDVGDTDEITGLPKEMEDKVKYFNFHYVVDQWMNSSGNLICELKDRSGNSIIKSAEYDGHTPMCFLSSRYYKVMNIYGA